MRLLQDEEYRTWSQEDGRKPPLRLLFLSRMEIRKKRHPKRTWQHCKESLRRHVLFLSLIKYFLLYNFNHLSIESRWSIPVIHAIIYIMSINRKQRRLQEKSSGMKTTKKIRDNAELALEKKQIGMALKNKGREAEAITPLKEALRLDSSLADVHFALAMIARTKPERHVDMEKINASIKDKKFLLSSYSAIMILLRQKRQYKEAVICQEEICRLKPDDIWARVDLALLLNIAGQVERAAIELSLALNKEPQNIMLKGLYSSSLHNPSFNHFHPEVKQAFLECFKNLYDVHLRNFWAPWLTLMMKDPEFAEIKNARMLDDTAFIEWADSLDEESGAFLNNPYLTKGLCLLVVADYLMERFFTRLRRYLCLNYETLVSNGRIKIFEKFIDALAQQCFFNEYVYMQQKDEEQSLQSLGQRKEKTAIALCACYTPLYKNFPAQDHVLMSLAEEDSDFAALVKTQYLDPAEEARIKAEIPVFGAFANEISRAVQSQYEENPYPRWTTICTTALPSDDLVFDPETKDLPFRILVAGCGTGRHAIGTATRYKNARITAIDLSRTSIAYGLRKARECGMDTRINFVHADILSMKDWPEPFDIIECAGVLHHMEDPFKGWEALNSILKPNGLFKIGLYSEISRQPIIKARDFVAAGHYPSTTEGIRACRQAIFALPTTDPIYNFVARSLDFHTASAARDLIFHVQEHRMTLPQIQEMMDRLGLVPLRMLVSNPDTLYMYDKMFPDDSSRKSFKNWEIFEKKFPLTFAGVYQFWCQKTVYSA